MGLCGLVMFDNYYLFEKFVYFNCEWILECVVYVRGSVVYGIFMLIKSLFDYIIVDFL